MVKPQVGTANASHSDLWLTGAVQVIFMSYYIPLPGLDDAGLAKVWDGPDVVSRIVNQDGNFHIAAPMEFRFVKGGDTAMSATFTDNPQNTWFGVVTLPNQVRNSFRVRNASAAATASRHVFIAVALKARCVLAEVRWRWT